MASDLRTVTILQAVWPPNFDAALDAGAVVELPAEIAERYIDAGYAMDGKQGAGVVKAAEKIRNKQALAASEGE